MKSMAGHVRHMMKHGARTMAAMAVMWPAGVALAKPPADETCTDPLKCFSHEKPVTPQNVYKNLTYERTVDGDTFVAGGKTIRVWGIDAPERGDPVFLASKMYMEVLLENARELRCKFIDVDRFGRAVMHCQADGLDIGSLMVQMGMARDYRNYSGGYYAEEERWAREAGAGIWKDR
jgi:endonuclease YncB( thermonuclease family)